jgi:hypothetical protein
MVCGEYTAIAACRKWDRGIRGHSVWQRWKSLATLEKSGNAGKVWQRWKSLATLEKSGNAGKVWQRWKSLATLEKN